MKQAYLAGLFALTTALIAHPLMAHAECFTAGEQCPDGSTFVGQSEDGKYALYAARCDAGQYWNGSQCEGKSAGLPWNDGTANWLNTSQRACDEQGGGGAFKAQAISCYDGKASSTLLLTADSATTTGGREPHLAAEACSRLDVNGHKDWYLPSLYELSLLHKIGAMRTRLEPVGDWYWSSSEYDKFTAWFVSMANGERDTEFKISAHGHVRCMRRAPMHKPDSGQPSPGRSQ